MGMIELRDVLVHYGVEPVLKGVSLTIERGARVAVVGPNGMGKSTLLKVMAGLLSPLTGEVALDGLVRRSTVEAERAARERVFYLPDSGWLPMHRTGREYLMSVGRLYGVEYFRLRDHVSRLLEVFHLDALGDKALAQYSTGQRRKLEIASALVSEAPVLLLDEPFSGGLDPAGLLATRKLLRHDRRGGRGGRAETTVVLTSPVPELIEEVADRIVVIKEGRIVANDTIEGLRRSTGCRGSLAEILEKLVFPETADRVERYFEAEEADFEDRGGDGNPGEGWGGSGTGARGR